MRKRTFTGSLALMLVLVAVLAWAAPIDYLIGTSDQLKNANPVTEEQWLEGLPGLTSADSQVKYIFRYESSYLPGNSKSLDGWDPELYGQWTYAVVKYGDNWAAYRDEGDGLLSVGPFRYGISHVTFFGNAAQVPEAGTILLLGLGLLGLGIATRRKS